MSAALALPAQETALLILDCQNDIGHPDGVSGRLGSPLPLWASERGIFSYINLLSGEMRRAGATVIFVRHVYRPDYSDAPPNALGRMVREQHFCPDGGWGAEIVAALDRAPGDIVLTKNRESAFRGTRLEEVLRARGISRLVLTGIATDGAVEGTAREAQDRDYLTVIVSDCCVGSSDEAHRATIGGLMAVMGVVAPVDEVIAAIAAQGSTGLNHGR